MQMMELQKVLLTLCVIGEKSVIGGEMPWTSRCIIDENIGPQIIDLLRGQLLLSFLVIYVYIHV